MRVGLMIGTLGAYGKLYGGPILRDLLGDLYHRRAGCAGTGADPDPVFRGHRRHEPAAAGDGLQQDPDCPALRRALAFWALCRVPIRPRCCAARSLRFPQARSRRRVPWACRPACWRAASRCPRCCPSPFPGLANLWLIVTKDTALLAVVGFAELTQATRQAAGTTKAYFTFFMAAGVLYLMLVAGFWRDVCPDRALGPPWSARYEQGRLK